MREFYHNFSALGLSLPQRGGIYPSNQAAKAPIITRYLKRAIDELGTLGASQVTVAELFCADAYYSFLARLLGADRCDAFDNDRDGHLAEALYVRGILNDEGVTLHKQDVFDIDPSFRADVVLNCGGLYHVADPLSALAVSRRMARHFLIVQSVVSLADESSDYFEAPAPGWTWGCRFSFAWLKRAVEEHGRIIEQERNLLTGNERPEDRGSAYFLVTLS